MRRLFALLATIPAVLVHVVSPASAEPDLLAVQEKLDRAAIAISAADTAGRANIVVSAKHNHVTVYWPGDVPAPVRAAARGHRVRFLPARFSQAELVSEARRIAGAGNGVLSAAPTADGSGVTVTVSADGDRRALSSRVPLTFEVEQAASAMGTRQADTPPFSGGSRYSTDVSPGCSNGFALKHPHGNFYMISAAHCGRENGPVFIPGQPGQAGYSFAVLRCRDTMAIGYPAGVQPRIYTGGVNSPTGAHVAGAAARFRG